MIKVTCFEDNSNVFGTLGKDNNGCGIDYEDDQSEGGEDGHDGDEVVQQAHHDQDDRDDGDDDSHCRLEDGSPH